VGNGYQCSLILVNGGCEYFRECEIEIKSIEQYIFNEKKNCNG
jgi:hypothetical protein